ncbi:DNA polymerase III subunit gamma/tau [uncultured Ruthenibacterium sp.]|uniref:DNA polymerase III subunit gamma/tau n=1 Tax=uncultured Ruthenibacterium sp. TaxID=1905347 RepID=UPI00349E5E83
MYRALYRKWRPKTFEDVVGQKEITTALQNQILHDKVGHAYIFTGTRGTGKTTCAKIFAKAVNCLSRRGADPCGTCSICKGIDDASVMDVVEIDAASNNGVDNIRDLRDETAYTPSECTYKVYIIDEVHMLSTAAFNALLKIMEEPPSHVIFILATTEIHKVPATILSRCQRYDFTRISPEDIEGRLLYVAEQEGIHLEIQAASLIARLADGAMRDALSILDTCAGVTNQVDADVVRRMAGVTDKSYLFELCEAVAAGNAAEALALVARLREKSIDIKRLCDELILHYRNLLLANVPNGSKLLVGVSEEEEKRYLDTASSVSQEAAIRAIRRLCEALDRMGKGTDPRIELELALFSLCTPEVKPMIPATPVTTAVHNGPMPFVSTPISETPIKNTPVQVQVVSEVPAVTDQPPWDIPAQKPVHEELSNNAEKHSTVQATSKPISKAPLPKLPDGVTEQVFAQWDSVIQAMETKDTLLYVNMKGTKAYYDGRRILIDGSDLFLEFMRQNEYSTELIKSTIQEITGIRYAIGPYKKKTQEKQQNTAQQTLQLLEQQGVEVIYEDDTKEEKRLL